MATTSQRICDGQSAASLRPQWQPTHGQECHGCKTYDVHKSQWLTNLPSCISGRRRCLTYNNEPTSIANSLAQSGVAHAKAAHAASAFAASPKLKGGGLEASARDGRVVCSCKAFVTSVLSTITARAMFASSTSLTIKSDGSETSNLRGLGRSWTRNLVIYVVWGVPGPETS